MVYMGRNVNMQSEIYEFEMCMVYIMSTVRRNVDVIQ